MHFRTEKAYVRGLAGGAFKGRLIDNVLFTIRTKDNHKRRHAKSGELDFVTQVNKGPRGEGKITKFL